MFFSFVFCSLIHILICGIGFHFFQHPTKELKHSIKQFRGARQNSHPYYFLCTTPTPAAAGAPLHFTPLSYSTASPHVKCCRKGAFFFSSAPETTIFLLTRRSAALPMCARGGTFVIDAPRQCFAFDIYTKIGYIS